MAALKRDNHYIPRFYLRNFTNDPSAVNGSFDFMNLKSGKHIGIIPHGSQMKEKYFYEKGSDIDDELGSEYEGGHATILRDILNEKSKSKPEALLEIVLLMHFRTRAQRDEDLFFRKNLIDQHLSYLISSFKSHLEKKFPFLTGKLNDQELEKIVRDGSYKEYLKETESAAKQIKNFKRIKDEIQGLNAVILNSPSQLSLVSSDRPVLLLNPFLNRKKVNFGKNGMFQRGILLILPISPI